MKETMSKKTTKKRNKVRRLPHAVLTIHMHSPTHPNFFFAVFHYFLKIMCKRGVHLPSVTHFVGNASASFGIGRCSVRRDAGRILGAIRGAIEASKVLFECTPTNQSARVVRRACHWSVQQTSDSSYRSHHSWTELQ